MKLWFKQLRHFVIEIRQRESAQRNFLHAVYGGHDRFAGYEQPTYLRKARTVACH